MERMQAFIRPGWNEDGPNGPLARPTKYTAGRAARLRVRVIASFAATCALLGFAAAPAWSKSIQNEFAAFSDCPVNVLGEKGVCVISTVTSGEFAIGSKTVPINKTVTLQGGIEGTTLVPAVDGNTLSKTPLQLPGGLAGIELLPPLTEVTATAELAGQGMVNLNNSLSGKGTAVGLPVVVKLDNPVLGSSCYIGTPSEPLQLNLTTGTTSPPPPNNPISGNPGTPKPGLGAPGITGDLGISLVDNAFAAPGVNGCGALPVLIDPLVDTDAGLPAAAGHNTAIMNGNVIVTEALLVKHWATLPELGRCSKAPYVLVEKEKVYHGTWLNASCTFESVGQPKFGEFEWSDGPGTGKKFTVSAGATAFETASGSKLTCTKGTGSGEYSGTKSSTLTLKLASCKFSGVKGTCHSEGATAGEIVTSPLTGKLGFIEDRVVEGNEVLNVGMDISAPSVLSAECGTQKVAVSGSAIGVFTPTNTMSKSFVVTFTQASGAQQPQSFEEEPKDTLSLSSGGGSPQAAGLSSKVKLVNEEKLAIKANI
jgi:hypothetical protein